MAAMAFGAFKIAGFRYMIFVRVFLEVLRPLGNSFHRLVAAETRLRGCRRFGLRLLVASIAWNVSFLVTVRGKNILSLRGGNAGPYYGRYGAKAKYSSDHVAHSFLE